MHKNYYLSLILLSSMFLPGGIVFAQEPQASAAAQDAVRIPPPPPAVTLPENAVLESADEPLAWRAKALALMSEYPFKERNSQIWILPVSYEKGQKILKEAIDQIGLDLISEFLDAGQFLLSAPEYNKQGEIIIVTQPISENSTMFKLRIYSTGRLINTQKANNIPIVMKSLLENQGLLQ